MNEEKKALFRIEKERFEKELKVKQKKNLMFIPIEQFASASNYTNSNEEVKVFSDDSGYVILLGFIFSGYLFYSLDELSTKEPIKLSTHIIVISCFIAFFILINYVVRKNLKTPKFIFTDHFFYLHQNKLTIRWNDIVDFYVQEDTRSDLT